MTSVIVEKWVSICFLTSIFYRRRPQTSRGTG